MATVFVVNKSSHDFTAAEQFGRLRYLSEGIESRYAVSKIYRMFAMSLRHSSPDDYILITGLTTMNVVACSCFSFIHGRLNLLLYKNDKYIERKIILSELLSKGGDITKRISDMGEEV